MTEIALIALFFAAVIGIGIVVKHIWGEDK
jgi:hypothetical protein